MKCNLKLGLSFSQAHFWCFMRSVSLSRIRWTSRGCMTARSMRHRKLRNSLACDMACTRRRDANRLGHLRAAPVYRIILRLIDYFIYYFQTYRSSNRRWARLVTLEPRNAFLEITLLPTPDGWLRHPCRAHDVNHPSTISGSQRNLCAPHQLA